MNENDNYDNFLKTIFSYAVVIRADIEQLQTLKRYLAEHKIKIVFQKTSTNKMFIKEDAP